MSVFKQHVSILTRFAFHSIRTVQQNIKPQLQLQNKRQIKRWVAPTLRELQRRKEKVSPESPARRSTFLEWNYDAEIFAFSKRLGEEFNNNDLTRALIHRSYIIEKEMEAEKNNTDPPPSIEDNSKMIQEGEEFIVKYLKRVLEKDYAKDPANAICYYLTSEETLSHVAKHLGLTDIILSADFPVEQSTLANTFKAVVDALKRSSGTERAEIFVKDFLISQLNDKELFDLWTPEKPYDYMLNLARQFGHTEIEPRLCNQSAANTILANYQVGLYSKKKLIGIGWGESIETAKDTAALDAIQRLQNEEVHKHQQLLS